MMLKIILLVFVNAIGAFIGCVIAHKIIDWQESRRWRR